MAEPFTNFKFNYKYRQIQIQMQALTLRLAEPFRNLNFSSLYINTRKSKSKPRALTLLLEETIYLKKYLLQL